MEPNQTSTEACGDSAEKFSMMDVGFGFQTHVLDSCGKAIAHLPQSVGIQNLKNNNALTNLHILSHGVWSGAQSGV